MTDDAPIKPAGFNLTIESTVFLKIEDIWPDGDAPENPTAKDVVALIAKCGGARTVIRDWSLDDDLVIDVDGEIAP